MYRNFLTILVFLILVSCGRTYYPDGSYTWGSPGTHDFYANARPSVIERYLNSIEIYGLCLIWEESSDHPSTRNIISSNLKKRGENPLLCYNPNSDRIRALEKKVEENSKKNSNNCGPLGCVQQIVKEKKE